jgi:phytoene desaturase
MQKIAVIGSGFAGLSAAATLAKAGKSVTVFEKNESAGGRARKFETHGYLFDMGPSWYWMPDVFEEYFNYFGKTTSDFYTLKRLDPSYRIYFGKDEILDVPAGLDALYQMFDTLEPGSSQFLRKFIEEGKYKYEVGINKLVRKPGLSILELADKDLFKGLFKLHVFQSISTYVRKYFKDPRLIQLLEFPVLFLGATPQNTPALYSLMNYADLALGTWYPMGGMHKIVEAMQTIAIENGVEFRFNSPVQKIEMNGVKSRGLIVNNTFEEFDYLVAGADYHHVEQNLIPEQFRKYSPTYWDKRVMAPSSLIFYLGVNKKLNNLHHHNLFFDQDFGLHAKEIYDNPAWPTNPLFYVCVTSKTDDSVAPEGHENVFVLVPVAPGLKDSPEIREQYFNLVMERLEKLTGQEIRSAIDYKRSYAHNDFIGDYNAFKGNAYGLANTLLQTANLKPSIINKKINNLFYTGQLTVPGPGVPPSIISGQVVAQQLLKETQKKAVL